MASGLVRPRSPQLSPGLFKELVLHLVKRELDATHRMTVLGWAWPVARQLAQLAVLVFVFGSVLDLGIPDFPVFVFCGLIAWAWFSAGTSAATSSLLTQRHLLFQPRLPPAVLPIVAIVVPLVDVAIALPVLGLLLVLNDGIPWTALLLPVPIAGQLVLMAGVAWLAAAGSVFMRDVPSIVAVCLTVLFYLTPVFYGLNTGTVPAEYQDLLALNPMATVVEGYRALLLHQPSPSGWAIGWAAGCALVLLALGWRTFTRLQHRFVDNL